MSIAAIQDNEGWQIVLLDTATAQNYLAGTGDTTVPVTGPMARRSYRREGVFLPDGELFVSRACCAGVPVRNVSKLMWEVSTSGALRHLVAIGFPALEHTGLAMNRSGKWLLYLGRDHAVRVLLRGPAAPARRRPDRGRLALTARPGLALWPGQPWL